MVFAGGPAARGMVSAGKPIADAGLTQFDWLRLVSRSSLSIPERHLARVLAGYGTASGTDIWPGNVRLARAIGYSKPDLVGPHLKALRDKGWIVQAAAANARRDRNARYVLAIPLDIDEQLVYEPDEL